VTFLLPFLGVVFAMVGFGLAVGSRDWGEACWALTAAAWAAGILVERCMVLVRAVNAAGIAHD
jgi:hypothetical protein